jgi:hypothetical protein
MVKQIVPDFLSWSTYHIHLCFGESVLSTATAFAYSRSGETYLITNWHNVTGRSPLTGECLSPLKAVPDILSTLFRPNESVATGRGVREHLALYENQMPVWLEHPVHRKSVDVVAVPLPKPLQEAYKLFPINDEVFDPQFAEKIADDVFVLGYPFSELTPSQFPIWKRGSIATEPDINYDGLPKFLIDTATRSGLSGSPVVMRRVGVHSNRAPGTPLDGTEIIGRIQNFVGVYSGRIGTDELKAQLGIVWKTSVIDEIIDGQVRGADPLMA